MKAEVLRDDDLKGISQDTEWIMCLKGISQDIEWTMIVGIMSGDKG